jgi:hypothetical protein
VAAIISAAASTSASSNTITGALPPSSRWTRLRSSAAALATSRPARTLPVIETMAGALWATRAAPVARSPTITFITPSGRNSLISSAIQMVVTGVVSLGLRTTALPAAIAGANFHTAIMNG